MRKWFLITAFVAACGGGSDDEPDTSGRTEQCERARDHLVDLRLAGSEALGKIELEKHRVALTNALGTQFMDTCSKTLSKQQLACLLSAANSDDINGCNTASSGN